MTEKLKQPRWIIREADYDDLLDIRTMHAKSWLETYPDEENGVSEDWVRERVSAWTTPDGIQKSREHFKDIFGNPDHFYRIAEKDGEIVGLVHGSQSDGLQNLEALYVDKSEHGKGLAQDLMGLVDEWFDDTLPVKLGVASYNDRAIRFYEKYGFKIIPDSKSMYADKIPIVDMIRPGEGQKYPNLNPKLEIKDSPVEGKSIFAKVPIKKGEKITININPEPVEVFEFTDEKFDKFRQDCIQKGLQWDSVSLGNGKHRAAIAEREKNPENYGNHSCDPSLSKEYVTLRDIKPGDELTVDYSEFSDKDWEMKCHCGSKNCKGTVKGRVE